MYPIVEVVEYNCHTSTSTMFLRQFIQQTIPEHRNIIVTVLAAFCPNSCVCFISTTSLSCFAFTDMFTALLFLLLFIVHEALRVIQLKLHKSSFQYLNIWLALHNGLLARKLLACMCRLWIFFNYLSLVVGWNRVDIKSFAVLCLHKATVWRIFT